MTEHIVDVREGQNSDGFDRYPYDEMKDQSLSVLVEGEKRSMYASTYAKYIMNMHSKFYTTINITVF